MRWVRCLISTNILLSLFSAPFFNSTEAFGLPPLPSYDWPNPRYFDGLDTPASVGGINLHTKTLDGYEDQSKIAVLEYDEAYNSSNKVANFELKSIRFQSGQTVDIPIVLIPNFGEKFIEIGVRRFRLTEMFDLNPSSGCLGRKKGYTLPKHGRYFFRSEWGGTCTSHLSDTATKISYTMQPPYEDGIFNPSGYYKPLSAELPDGYIVNFYFEHPYNVEYVTRLELRRAGVLIETVNINYSGYLIDTITSSIDPSRNIKLSYVFSQTVLGSILEGGDLTVNGAVDGRHYYYISLSGPPHPHKYAIYWITNLKGKYLAKYGIFNLTLPQGERRVYKRVRFGELSIDGENYVTDDFSLLYLANNQVSITSRMTPLNPITLTLDAARGVAIKTQDALCPNPLEEVNFYPAGSPHEGLLFEQKLRPRCGELITKTYNYGNGGEITSVVTAAGNESSTVSFEHTKITLPNTVKTKEVSKVTDALGNFARTNYNTTNGRVMSVEYDSGNIQESYQYEYVNPADEKSIQKVTITRPNSRQDYTKFDSMGRPDEFAVNVGTSDTAIANVFYDQNTGRVQSVRDFKLAIHNLTYNDNGSALKTDSRIAELSEGIPGAGFNESYQYSANYPALLETTTSTYTGIYGTSSTLTTTNIHVPGTYLISEVRAEGSGIVGNPTIRKSFYNPNTLKIEKTCGYSQDGSNQSCVDYTYKTSSAGPLQGRLDKVDVGGSSSGSGFTISPTYDSYGYGDGDIRTDATKSTQVKYEFDDLARLERVTHNPAAGENEVKEEFLYDQAGKLRNTKVYTGGVKVSDKTRTYANNGKSEKLTFIEDQISGLNSYFEYNDPAGRVTYADVVTSGGSVLSALEIPPSAYNLLDQPTQISYQVDGAGLFSESASYSRWGELLTNTNSQGVTNSYVYDNLSRVITAISGSGSQTTYLYGVNNGLPEISATSSTFAHDPELAFTWNSKIRFDAFGRFKESSLEEANIITTNTYDNRGNLGTSTKSGAWAETTEFLYDAFNRLIEVKNDGESLGSAVFSGLGDLTISKDARGNATTYTYDKLSRRRSTTYPDNRTENITSISFGAASSNPNSIFQTITGTNRALDSITKTYNLFGSLISENISSAEYGPLARTLTYDPSTLRLQSNVVTSDGVQRSLSYDYDAFGRKKIETSSMYPPSGPQFSIGWTYDSQGQLVQHTYPNGEIVEYNRDIYGRIQSISLDGVPLTVYTHDGPFVTDVTYAPGHEENFTRQYVYNGVQGFPLLSGYKDSKRYSTLVDVTYGYDARFRIDARTDVGIRGFTETFGYTSHNMLDVYTAESEFLEKQFVGRFYDAKPDGILDSFQNPDGFFKLPESFSYDLRGNPLSDADTRSYTWSHLGLIEVEDPAMLWSTEILHDAAGRNTQVITEHIGGETETTIFGRDRGLVLWRYKEQYGDPN